MEKGSQMRWWRHTREIVGRADSCVREGRRWVHHFCHTQITCSTTTTTQALMHHDHHNNKQSGSRVKGRTVAEGIMESSQNQQMKEMNRNRLQIISQSIYLSLIHTNFDAPTRIEKQIPEKSTKNGEKWEKGFREKARKCVEESVTVLGTGRDAGTQRSIHSKKETESNTTAEHADQKEEDGLHYWTYMDLTSRWRIFWLWMSVVKAEKATHKREQSQWSGMKIKGTRTGKEREEHECKGVSWKCLWVM